MKKEQLTAYLEYSEERFTKRDIFKEGGTNAFVLNFKPGQILPSHTHPKTSVHLFVLKGTGTFTINQKKIKVEENEVLVVNEHDEVGFINDGPDNASLYVMLNRKVKSRRNAISYNLIDYKEFSS